MMLNMLAWISMAIPVLLNVAFFTLLERKILGLSQSRKGPNKVSLGGITQPFADAIKLFMKQVTTPTNSSQYLFLCAPGLAMALALFLWSIIPSNKMELGLTFSVICMIFILSLGLYPLLVAGWSSMSAYASIGAMRGVAQTISYEIGMALFILSILVIAGGSSWTIIYLSNPYAPMVLGALPVLALWLVCCVAETNRTPFDFSEGESELVSGFNIEYGAGTFALIFMAEYATILALSTFTAMLTTGQLLVPSSALLALALAYFWVWLRATLPRYRYDMLMKTSWTCLLPASLCLLMFFSSI